MILKAVMSPTEPERVFVDQVARLLPDIDKTEFQKLLEMKVCINNNNTFVFYKTAMLGPLVLLTLNLSGPPD